MFLSINELQLTARREGGTEGSDNVNLPCDHPSLDQGGQSKKSVSTTTVTVRVCPAAETA